MYKYVLACCNAKVSAMLWLIWWVTFVNVLNQCIKFSNNYKDLRVYFQFSWIDRSSSPVLGLFTLSKNFRSTQLEVRTRIKSMFVSYKKISSLKDRFIVNG